MARVTVPTITFRTTKEVLGDVHGLVYGVGPTVGDAVRALTAQAERLVAEHELGDGAPGTEPDMQQLIADHFGAVEPGRARRRYEVADGHLVAGTGAAEAWCAIRTLHSSATQPGNEGY